MIRSEARPASQSWLPVERLDGGVMELRDGSLRAVLDCPTLAFGLRGEGEQRAVMHAWAGLLNSLPHPLHFLIQTRSMHPADLSLALQQEEEEVDTPCARLRSSYAQLMSTMSSSRRVVGRRFYTIVPWEPIALSHLFSRKPQLGRDNAVGMLEQRVRW